MMIILPLGVTLKVTFAAAYAKHFSIHIIVVYSQGLSAA